MGDGSYVLWNWSPLEAQIEEVFIELRKAFEPITAEMVAIRVGRSSEEPEFLRAYTSAARRTKLWEKPKHAEPFITSGPPVPAG